MSGRIQVRRIYNVHGWDQANVFSRVDGLRFVTLFSIRANVLKAKHDVFIKISTGKDCLTDNPLEGYSRESFNVLLPEDLQIQVASVIEELKGRSIYDVSNMTLVMSGFGEVSYNPYAPLLFKWVKSTLKAHGVGCEQLNGFVSTIAPKDNPRFDRFLLDMQSVSDLLDESALTVIIGPSDLAKREVVYNSNVLSFEEIEHLLFKCCKSFKGDFKLFVVEEDLNNFSGESLKRFNSERYEFQVTAIKFPEEGIEGIPNSQRCKFVRGTSLVTSFVTPEDLKGD